MAKYVLIDCRRDMGNEDPENASVVETDIKRPHLNKHTWHLEIEHSRSRSRSRSCGDTRWSS